MTSSDEQLRVSPETKGLDHMMAHSYCGSGDFTLRATLQHDRTTHWLREGMQTCERRLADRARAPVPVIPAEARHLGESRGRNPVPRSRWTPACAAVTANRLLKEPAIGRRGLDCTGLLLRQCPALERFTLKRSGPVLRMGQDPAQVRAN
jgi:hypothetical protein